MYLLSGCSMDGTCYASEKHNNDSDNNNTCVQLDPGVPICSGLSIYRHNPNRCNYLAS